MSRFVNGAIIAIVAFIALVSVYWYSTDMKQEHAVEVGHVVNAWGPVDTSVTELRSTLTFHNPHPSPVELVRLEHEILVNGERADWEQRNVSVRMPPQSNRSVDFVARFPTTFLGPWWSSHVRQGEQTTVVVRGLATFMVLQTLVEVPYESQSTWSTHLADDITQALENCETSREAPCIREAAVSWANKSSQPELGLRLTLENANETVWRLRNWTMSLFVGDLPFGSTETVPGPIELAGGSHYELDVRLRIAPSLASWWPAHIARCEASPVRVLFNYTREHQLNTSYDATQNASQNSTDPSTLQTISDPRSWAAVGPDFETRFACVKEQVQA